MSVATATMRPPRRRLGPALRRLRVPIGGLVLSSLLHLALAAVILLAGQVWRASQPKAYVVNLVPAVPAIGSPQSRAPQTTTPAPPTPSLPEREPVRTPERPSKPTELPERTPPPREAVSLPDRSLPSRTPALPRPGEKELPRVASAPSMPTRAVPPPPAPPGRPTGSAQGAGTMTLSASGDFPFTWYLQRVRAKIGERWEGKAQDGTQPQVVFEISRDGKIQALKIEKSSGNSLYDQAAMRAITEANPFPPLPDEFREAYLRVHMGFEYAATKG